MGLLLADIVLLLAGLLMGLLVGAMTRLGGLGWIAAVLISGACGIGIGLALFADEIPWAWLLTLSFAAGCAIALYRAFMPAHDTGLLPARRVLVPQLISHAPIDPGRKIRRPGVLPQTAARTRLMRYRLPLIRPTGPPRPIAA
jgi:hypothetical protein